MAQQADEYYFADGRRIGLRRDPAVAALLAERAVSAVPALKPAVGRAQALRAGVVLLPAGDIPEPALGRLREAAALLPVFAAEGARLVVLPEVRIEADDEAQAERIGALLASAGVAADAIAREGFRFTVTPASGSGLDALHLANLVHERLAPPLAQARFIRVVPAPGRSAR